MKTKSVVLEDNYPVVIRRVVVKRKFRFSENVIAFCKYCLLFSALSALFFTLGMSEHPNSEVFSRLYSSLIQGVIATFLMYALKELAKEFWIALCEEVF